MSWGEDEKDATALLCGQSESFPEALLAVALLGVHLPPVGFAAQYEALNCRLDFAFPGLLIAVEVDGFEHHERTQQQASRDRARDRRLAAEGWTVLRFMAVDVMRNPMGVAREVAAILWGEHCRREERARRAQVDPLRAKLLDPSLSEDEQLEALREIQERSRARVAAKSRKRGAA